MTSLSHVTPNGSAANRGYHSFIQAGNLAVLVITTGIEKHGDAGGSIYASAAESKPVTLLAIRAARGEVVTAVVVVVAVEVEVVVIVAVGVIIGVVALVVVAVVVVVVVAVVVGTVLNAS